MIRIDREFTPNKDSDPISSQNQDYLADAEGLGKSCADYLVNTYRGKDKEEEWFRQVNVLAEKYGLQHYIPRIASEPYDLYICSKADMFKDFCRRPKKPEDLEYINRDILVRNRASFSLQDLYNPRMIIFSPLSTDYLLAYLLRKFVEISLSEDYFMLKPIIVSSRNAYWMRVLAMPDYRDKAYANTGYGGIFVENYINGDTRKICQETALTFFSGLRGLA